MEKTIFQKIFLVSFLLVLLGQSCSGLFSCSSDADCAEIMTCIPPEEKPKCALATQACFCPQLPPPPPPTPSNGPKRVYNIDQL
ncbi:hypothetical protein P3L10_010909 [Capsicum annuum]